MFQWVIGCAQPSRGKLGSFQGKVKSTASSTWFCSVGPNVGDKEIVMWTSQSTYSYCKAKEKSQEGEQSVPQGYLECGFGGGGKKGGLESRKPKSGLTTAS